MTIGCFLLSMIGCLSEQLFQDISFWSSCFKTQQSNPAILYYSQQFFRLNCCKI